METRIPLREASILAAEVASLMAPTVERLDIAGSIRRKKETIGDIEIVSKPKLVPVPNPSSLFQEPRLVNLQLAKVNELLLSGVFEHRVDVHGRPACGEKFQRLLYKGFPLDSFSVIEPAEYGVILLIRTGSKEFNERFVLQWSAGGKILPAGMRFEGGALWDRGRKLSTPEEEDVFAAVGLEYVRPEDRSS